MIEVGDIVTIRKGASMYSKTHGQSFLKKSIKVKILSLKTSFCLGADSLVDGIVVKLNNERIEFNYTDIINHVHYRDKKDK